MSSRHKKHLAMLELFKKASPKVRSEILKNCTKSLLCCICKCAKNVLIGNVPLTKAQKTKLSRHKNKLRQLVLKKTRVADKKKLIQTGGLLGALIPLVARSWAISLLLEFKKEHAKTMVLLEPRQIGKWRETPLDKVLSKLDGQICDILDRAMAATKRLTFIVSYCIVFKYLYSAPQQP